MKVLVVSGIWPPDVGGPASHAPDVAAFLAARGHTVEVVTTAAAAPAARPYPVRWTSRRLPKGARHLHGAILIALRARRVDVVYTTGMFARSAIGATLARRPYAVKLTGDPAFERLRARGTVGGDVEQFQRERGSQARALSWLRKTVLRGATHVFCPSEFLRALVVAWGVDPARTDVLPNPAPILPELAPRDELRRRFGMDGPTLAFAGRITVQKALEVALAAVAAVPGVRLLVAGDGPERAAVEQGVARHGLGERVSLLGAQPREEILGLFHAADASLLSSNWENFPHGVVESLAVGTPVIATDVGGVAEVVVDGENGLLVPASDVAALAAAIGRFLGEEGLAARLRANAVPSVAAYAPEAVLAKLEAVLVSAGSS